jgi:hypothetical protein
MAEASRRSRFGSTVLVGVLTAALAAVASAKPWFRLAPEGGTATGLLRSQGTVDMPLALALALVVLAGWGAVLVSRGVLRRVLVAIALAAALGVVGCVATAPFVLPSDLRDGLGPSAAGAGVDPTGWFAAAAIASVLSALVLVTAWRLVPRWPTMSSRYDAPADGAATGTPADTPTDLWRALDQGRDPTEPPGSPPP